MSDTGWAFLKGFQIVKNGMPYLDRLRVVQTPLFSVYLHRIHTPDMDRDPHTHPWAFASVVLSGGYRETVWDDPGESWKCRRRERGRFSVGSLNRVQAHRITEVSGVLWTLVVTGPRRGSWGFWTQDGFVDWKKYGADPDPLAGR